MKKKEYLARCFFLTERLVNKIIQLIDSFIDQQKRWSRPIEPVKVKTVFPVKSEKTKKKKIN